MAGRPYTPLNRKPFVWIDTETTGLDPEHNDIIEFAAIRSNADGTERVLYAKVHMERPDNAHPRALEVNGYSEAAWADAREPRTVASSPTASSRGRTSGSTPPS